jgi:hypothetical protein
MISILSGLKMVTVIDRRYKGILVLDQGRDGPATFLPLLFGEVVFVGVFLDHAPGGVLGDEGDHGATHHGNPTARDAAVVAVEEGGDDLLGQGLI